LGSCENGRKGSTNTERTALARNQDQGVDAHEQRKKREEGKKGQEAEEREGRFQEKGRRDC
jgi:hypothetical protein